MKKFLKISLISAIALSSIVATQFFQQTGKVSATNLNVIQKNGAYKVMVGQSLSPDKEVKKSYISQRKKLMDDLAVNKSEQVNTGTITLNSFITLDDVENFIRENKNIHIKTLWFSIPYETGRGAVVVENNNVKQAMKNFLEKAAKSMTQDTNANKDYKKIIDGNYGIFALTIETKNKEFPNISSDKHVKFVDLHFTSSLQSEPSQDGSKIQYIEIPEKPDGTK